MLGQQLPTKESSACLQVESDQPAMSGSSGSGKRYFRIGLTGLALVGVAAWAAFRHDSTSQPSAVDPTLAYMPVPARNAGGLRSHSSGVRPRTHPVYVGMNGGKGFGGGEATRDPEPTLYDPNDPNWKKTAIHKAESFEDYMAKRNAGSAVSSAPMPAPQAYVKPVAAAAVQAYASPAPAPHGGKGFGGGEATRDPEPTLYDPNDPNWKKTAIHKAESFEEYMAKRNAAGSAPAYVPQVAASPAMPNPPAAAAAPAAHAAPISSEDAAKAAWLANNKPEWERPRSAAAPAMPNPPAAAAAAPATHAAPTVSEDAAKAAWLADNKPEWDRPRSAATPAMPHAPRTAATSEDAAKAAWMARQDFTPWGQGSSASAPRGAAATQPTAASDYFGLPSTPEEATKSVAAAKAAWLANQDFPVWGQGHGASTNSEEAAKAAWLARNDMQHAGMHR